MSRILLLASLTSRVPGFVFRGKTILVVDNKFGLFLGRIHSKPEVSLFCFALGYVWFASAHCYRSHLSCSSSSSSSSSSQSSQADQSLHLNCLIEQHENTKTTGRAGRRPVRSATPSPLARDATRARGCPRPGSRPRPCGPAAGRWP